MVLNLLNPISWFDGGGGTASSTVTSNVNIEMRGLDKIGQTIDVKPLELRPLTLNANVDVKPLELKPVTLNTNVAVKPLELKPVTLNSNVDVKPLELRPVTFNENIDLKPVAVDTCQTFKLAPLPETHVSQPYHHHVGYTLFGMEYLGVTFEGESEQAIKSPRRAHVTERTGGTHGTRSSPAEFRGGRGIRVRVLDPGDE